VSHKRVILVIGYEGIDSWVDMMLRHAPQGRLKTLYAKAGTMRELARIELGEGEELVGLGDLKKRKRGAAPDRG